nr:DNA-protecting protein DprA [Bacteroidales bacterium]
METSNYSEKVCLCTLNRIFGFEPKLGMRLIEHFGSATGVFENLDEVAGVLEYSGKYLVDLGESSAKENLDKNAEELEKLGREGCRFVGINEEAYPNALKEIEDPPLGLYYKGKNAPEDVLNRIPSIAIIGTRDLTEYGRDWCWKIVEEFSRCGIKPMIVSGFALGVDIAAHLAALRYGLPTVGVLPTGIDSVYPHQHRGVAAQVC